MRTLFLLLLATSLSFFSQAQTNLEFAPDSNSKRTDDSSAVINNNIRMPIFNADPHHSFQRYISKKIKYPEDAKRKKIEGSLYVMYTIETDGSVSNVEIMPGKNLYPSCDAEVIRIVSNSPKWTPAYQNGHPYKIRMCTQVTFNILINN